MYLKCKFVYLITVIIVASSERIRQISNQQDEVYGILHSIEQYDDPHLTVTDEFPWVVSINYKEHYKNRKTNIQFRCLGTLIDTQFVITSASCVDIKWWQLDIDFLRIGINNIDIHNVECVKIFNSNDCTASTVDLKVDRVITYPDYDPVSLAENLAIIKLARNVTYTDYVRPICWNNYKINNLVYNYTYWTSGYLMGDKNTVVKKSDVQIIGQDECVQKLSLYFRASYNMTQNAACARDGVKSPCIIDAGSPLMFSSDGQWHLEGISSFNTNCSSNRVNVYTKLSNYTTWVKETISNLTYY